MKKTLADILKRNFAHHSDEEEEDNDSSSGDERKAPRKKFVARKLKKHEIERKLQQENSLSLQLFGKPSDPSLLLNPLAPPPAKRARFSAAEEEEEHQPEKGVPEEKEDDDEVDAQDDSSSSSSSSDSDDEDDGVQELNARNLILNFSDEEDEEEDEEDDDEEGADKNADYGKVFKDASDDDDDDESEEGEAKKSVWKDDEDDEVLVKFEKETSLSRRLKVKPSAEDPGLTAAKMEKRLRDHYLQMHDSKDFSWTEAPSEGKRKGRDLVRSTDEGFDDSDDSDDDDNFGLPEGMEFSQTSLPLINRSGIFGARLNPDSIRTTFVNYANKQDRAKVLFFSFSFFLFL